MRNCYVNLYENSHLPEVGLLIEYKEAYITIDKASQDGGFLI